MLLFLASNECDLVEYVIAKQKFTLTGQKKKFQNDHAKWIFVNTVLQAFNQVVFTTLLPYLENGP